MVEMAAHMMMAAVYDRDGVKAYPPNFSLKKLGDRAWLEKGWCMNSPFILGYSCLYQINRKKKGCLSVSGRLYLQWWPNKNVEETILARYNMNLVNLVCLVSLLVKWSCILFTKEMSKQHRRQVTGESTLYGVAALSMPEKSYRNKQITFYKLQSW